MQYLISVHIEPGFHAHYRGDNLESLFLTARTRWPGLPMTVYIGQDLTERIECDGFELVKYISHRKRFKINAKQNLFDLIEGE